MESKGSNATPQEIRELRGKRTQKEFGRLIWRSERTIQLWESGKAPIPKGMIEIINMKLAVDNNKKEYGQ